MSGKEVIPEHNSAYATREYWDQRYKQYGCGTAAAAAR
jgi:hypothetical protein